MFNYFLIFKIVCYTVRPLLDTTSIEVIDWKERDEMVEGGKKREKRWGEHRVMANSGRKLNLNLWRRDISKRKGGEKKAFCEGDINNQGRGMYSSRRERLSVVKYRNLNAYTLETDAHSVSREQTCLYA